ncbi:hypothetical protein SprV_0902700600 [Sparganum proliferum]
MEDILQTHLAIKTIELLLQSKYNETENRLRHDQVLQLLRFCLRTNFTFDGTFYDQGKGTPMGSRISGFIAETVLEQLESLVFQHHRPKFWVRYADDTFVVIDRDQLLTFKEHLNVVFPDVQFTMGEEKNNQLAFLNEPVVAAAYIVWESSILRVCIRRSSPLQQTWPSASIFLFGIALVAYQTLWSFIGPARPG